MSVAPASDFGDLFARDVAARCARIAEALADGDQILAGQLVEDFEHDARTIAASLEPLAAKKAA